jgi:hypothetical protein
MTVLSREELISALQHEVRVLLHLASKMEPEMGDYRPSPKQRSTMELLRYLTIMGPIHLRAVLADSFDMEGWRNAWSAGEANAKGLSLDEVKTAIGQQAALFAELLGACSDSQLRAEITMFGRRASRGSMLVSLVLSHYTAYRMQLFLYLKSSGRQELDTMNLWAGMDAPKKQ